MLERGQLSRIEDVECALIDQLRGPGERRLTIDGPQRGIDRVPRCPGAEYFLGSLEFPDVAKTCEAVRAKGGTVTREAGPVKGGTTVIAFVADPDGYKIEFIERRPA